MNRKLYNPNTSNLWDRLLFEENKNLLKSPFYIDKINRVLGFLRKHKGKFLDIGLGRGNLEKRMMGEDLDFEIYGVDISSRAIAEANRRIKGKFYVASVFKLPFKPSFFDVVIILDVLEHIEKGRVLSALKEIYRVLKKDGALMVSVPLNESLGQLIKEDKNYNAHLREYTPEILSKELEYSGLKIEKVEFIYAFREYYKIKSFIMKFVPGFREPNLIIVFAKK